MTDSKRVTREPRTEAGRALIERLGWFASEKGDALLEGVLAIEDESTPPPSEAVDAARERVERSVLGRCIDPRCPSQHVDDARDCIIAAFVAYEAAIRAESGLDVERLANAYNNIQHAMMWPGQPIPMPMWRLVMVEYARLGGER